MVKGHPKINFWASGIKRQTATKALRHPGHPLATLSLCSGVPLVGEWALRDGLVIQGPFSPFHRCRAGSGFGWLGSNAVAIWSDHLRVWKAFTLLEFH
jgi:hypothetical protein